MYYCMALIACSTLGLVIDMVACNGMTLNVALMTPWSGGWPDFSLQATSGAAVAFEDIESFGLLPGYSINWTWKDSQCLNPVGTTVLEEAYAYFNGSLNVIIGEGCSPVCQTYGLLASAWNVPVISYDCYLPELSNKSIYTTSARLSSSSFVYSSLVDKIFFHFDWTRIAIISDTREINFITADNLASILQLRGMTVYRYVVDAVFDTGVVIPGKIPGFLDMLENIRSKARILLYVAYDVQFLVYAAYKLGMANGEYVFIQPITITDQWPNFDDNADASGYGGLKNMGPPFSQDVYTGTMYLKYSAPDPTLWTNFTQRAMATFDDPHFSDAYIKDQGINITTVNRDFSIYAGVMYYCTMLWAVALNNTLEDQGTPEDGRDIVRHMLNLSMSFGPFGSVFINGHGDGSLSYDIVLAYDTTPVGSNYTVLFRYNQTADELISVALADPNATIPWPGGRHSPPSGEPPCGWNGCPIFWTESKIVGVAISCSIAIILCALLIPLFVNRILHARFKETAVRAAFIHKDDVGRLRRSKALNRSTVEESRDDIGLSARSLSHSSLQFHDGSLDLIMIQNQSSYIQKRTIVKEVEQMIKIQHENLCKFVGVCLDPGNRCVVMSHCMRGSLQDAWWDTTLTNGFLISFAIDVAEGLLYLHQSELGSHGLLTSQCCYLDTMWMVKISDYGMAHFRQRRLVIVKMFSNPANLLWTAPELLRIDPHKWPVYGTQAGDVYSYAIILQEIISKDLPYGGQLTRLGPREIVNRVKDKSATPFRPCVTAVSDAASSTTNNSDNKSTSDTVDVEAWVKIMKTCWSEQPAKRPPMAEVRDSVRGLQQAMGQNVSCAEKSIRLVEDRNIRLERLHADKTADLLTASTKWEQMLKQLLPSFVVSQLLRKEDFRAESVESVTVGFADIVDFHKLVVHLRPMHVVAFVNQIQETFAAAADKYEVVIIDSLGDCYMFSSGLAVSSIDVHHAKVIATMSLELLHKSLSLRVPVPQGQDNVSDNRQVQLRIALHSGPVVAGVTGMDRPRYSLYGETVNTASRLLENGQALRIHLSSDTAALLQSNNDHDFVLECCDDGDIGLIWRGKTTTYWLIGKRNLNLTLPNRSLAAID